MIEIACDLVIKMGILWYVKVKPTIQLTLFIFEVGIRVCNVK